MRKIRKKNFRYLIFFLVFIIVSILLAFLFDGAIAQNIGVDYWQVVGEGFWLTLLAVLLGSAAIMFALSVIAQTGIFKGKGGFLAFSIAYAIMVVVFGILIYIVILMV